MDFGHALIIINLHWNVHRAREEIHQAFDYFWVLEMPNMLHGVQ